MHTNDYSAIITIHISVAYEEDSFFLYPSLPPCSCYYLLKPLSSTPITYISFIFTLPLSLYFHIYINHPQASKFNPSSILPIRNTGLRAWFSNNITLHLPIFIFKFVLLHIITHINLQFSLAFSHFLPTTMYYGMYDCEIKRCHTSRFFHSLTSILSGLLSL